MNASFEQLYFFGFPLVFVDFMKTFMNQVTSSDGKHAKILTLFEDCAYYTNPRRYCC